VFGHPQGALQPVRRPRHAAARRQQHVLGGEHDQRLVFDQQNVLALHPPGHRLSRA